MPSDAMGQDAVSTGLLECFACGTEYDACRQPNGARDSQGGWSVRQLLYVRGMRDGSAARIGQPIGGWDA